MAKVNGIQDFIKGFAQSSETVRQNWVSPCAPGQIVVSALQKSWDRFRESWDKKPNNVGNHWTFAHLASETNSSVAREGDAARPFDGLRSWCGTERRTEGKNTHFWRFIDFNDFGPFPKVFYINLPIGTFQEVLKSLKSMNATFGGCFYTTCYYTTTNRLDS
jgi:hypothetical protein